MIKKKDIANLISSFRILGTIFLLFLDPHDVSFLVVYSLCGLSDVLDGWIARATKTTSELGAKLDSVADLLYYAVMFLRICPDLWEVLPRELWYVAYAVVGMRIFSYSFVAIKFHRFASIHTYMNKLSGGIIFILPYFIFMGKWVTHASVAIAVITTIATIEELIIHLRAKTYESRVKSLFIKVPAKDD